MEQTKDKITFKEEYYSSNGQLRYKHQYLNDKQNGEQLRYFDNGKLRYRYQYLNGKLHGEQLSYNFDGQKYKNYYINGKLVSYEEWIKYNRDQKLQSIWEKIKIK